MRTPTLFGMPQNNANVLPVARNIKGYSDKVSISVPHTSAAATVWVYVRSCVFSMLLIITNIIFCFQYLPLLMTAFD